MIDHLLSRPPIDLVVVAVAVALWAAWGIWLRRHPGPACPARNHRYWS